MDIFSKYCHSVEIWNNHTFVFHFSFWNDVMISFFKDNNVRLVTAHQIFFHGRIWWDLAIKRLHITLVRDTSTPISGNFHSLSFFSLIKTWRYNRHPSILLAQSNRNSNELDLLIFVFFQQIKTYSLLKLFNADTFSLINWASHFIIFRAKLTIPRSLFSTFTFSFPERIHSNPERTCLYS